MITLLSRIKHDLFDDAPRSYIVARKGAHGDVATRIEKDAAA